MLVDMKLFAFLALATVLVGAWLWLKPRSGKVSKPSGVGGLRPKA
jgi:hypothetical protein